MILSDLISILVVVFLSYPWILLLRTGNLLYAKWAAGMLINEMLNHAFKSAFGNLGLSAFMRPSKATNCNMFNQGGKVGGAFGFPSGHMSNTVCFFTLGYLYTRNTKMIYLGILAVLAMGWARLQKQCHNVVQLVGGALIGCMVAATWYNLTVRFS